jgi:hypothetical protein
VNRTRPTRLRAAAIKLGLSPAAVRAMTAAQLEYLRLMRAARTNENDRRRMN